MLQPSNQFKWHCLIDSAPFWCIANGNVPQYNILHVHDTLGNRLQSIIITSQLFEVTWWSIPGHFERSQVRALHTEHPHPHSGTGRCTMGGKHPNCGAFRARNTTSWSGRSHDYWLSLLRDLAMWFSWGRPSPMKPSRLRIGSKLPGQVISNRFGACLALLAKDGSNSVREWTQKQIDT